MSEKDVADHVGGKFPGEETLTNEDGSGGIEVKWKTETGYRYDQKYYVVTDGTGLSGTMPEGEPGKLTYIFFKCNGGITAYEYTWTE